MLPLGIDSSTQGVKAVVYDAVVDRVVASANVNYGRDLTEFGSPEMKIRAVVEGQIANIRARTRWIGDFKTIYVIGGASRSKGILSVIADLFGAEVWTLDATDSAAIGGARIAAMALRRQKEG